MIALVVGHKSTSPGAENARRGLTEFEFNAKLAIDLWKRLSTVDVESVIIWRRTYKTLPADVNDVDPHFAVSLHANASFEHTARGSEVLYYHRSDLGAKIAAIFQEQFIAHLGTRDRGIRPRTAEDRGGYFLKETNCAAVICEPFFIDNDADLESVLDSSNLREAYVEAIKQARYEL